MDGPGGTPSQQSHGLGIESEHFRTINTSELTLGRSRVKERPE
jgi:hypothetical protein